MADLLFRKGDHVIVRYLFTSDREAYLDQDVVDGDTWACVREDSEHRPDGLRYQARVSELRRHPNPQPKPQEVSCSTPPRARA